MSAEPNKCPVCHHVPKPVRVGTDDGGYWSVECYHNQGGVEMFIGCHAETEELAVDGWNCVTTMEEK